MPSTFDELMREYLEPHVDDHFGVPFVVTPMKTSPNGRAAPDPVRPVVEGIAPFHDDPIDVGVQMGDRSLNSRLNDMRSLRRTNQPILSVDLKYFPLVADRPRQGDVVEVEGQKFDVVSAQQDGEGRIELQMVQVVD